MTKQPPPSSTHRGVTPLRIVLIVMLVLVAGLYIARGPLRGVGPGGGYDLSMLYSASKTWVQGGNPYVREECLATMQESGGGDMLADKQMKSFASLYPPTFFPLLSPLTVLDWQQARGVWAVVQTLSVLAIVVLLIQLVGTANRDWQLGIAILVLAWAPLHSAAYVGQPSALILALILLALLSPRQWVAGVCLAIASLLKPQIGLPFLILLSWERRWLALGIASGLTIVMTAITILRLQITAPTWRADLANNLEIFTAPDGAGSSLGSNPLVYQMIHTVPLLSQFGLTLSAASVVAWCIALVAAGLAVFGLWRCAGRDARLLLIAGLASVPLLPVYHRYYDAALLLLVIAWGVARIIRGRVDRWVLWVGLCTIPFLMPTPAVLAILHRRGTLPGLIYDTWAFQTLVMQHHSIFLVLLVAGLVIAALRCRPETIDANQKPTD